MACDFPPVHFSFLWLGLLRGFTHFYHSLVSLQISYDDDGLQAITFTAQGDMRQAINNLQSTVDGFGFVNSENVFKVSRTNYLKLEWRFCLFVDLR